MCDTLSTSKLLQEISRKCNKSSNSSTQASTQSSEPDDIAIEIPEWNNSANSIKGHLSSALLTLYQLLKQTGITKHSITPKKKKMYEAMKQLHKKYTMEINIKKLFRGQLFGVEQFRKAHHLEEKVANLTNMASMLIRCQL